MIFVKELKLKLLLTGRKKGIFTHIANHVRLESHGTESVRVNALNIRWFDVFCFFFFYQTCQHVNEL